MRPVLKVQNEGQLDLYFWFIHRRCFLQILRMKKKKPSWFIGSTPSDLFSCQEMKRFSSVSSDILSPSYIHTLAGRLKWHFSSGGCIVTAQATEAVDKVASRQAVKPF